MIVGCPPVLLGNGRKQLLQELKFKPLQIYNEISISRQFLKDGIRLLNRDRVIWCEILA